MTTAKTPAATKRASRKAEQRAEMIEQILDVSEELFSKHGLYGVTLADVAARIGVHRTLLSYYFRDKKELFDQVFARRAMVTSETRMRALEEHERAAGDAPTDRHDHDESLSRLDPALVSNGLLALTGEQAPPRAILCAGAGHFATANVTLTNGTYIGRDEGAGDPVIERWANIDDRQGEAVPAYGFSQAEREVASAQRAAAA